MTRTKNPVVLGYAGLIGRASANQLTTDLQETEGEEGEETEETVEAEAPWILQNAGLPQNGGLEVGLGSWTS